MGRMLLLLIALMWGGPALAAGSSVPLPAPEAGKGEACVAPTHIMRRDHPSMLTHQRDRTVLEGIRTKRFSLNECIACHAVDDGAGRPVSYESPKHFCRVCHDYAAVQIDCFQCHNSRPPPGPEAALLPMRRWCAG